MSSWGGKCPYCGETYRGLRDGVTMGQHRSPWYAPFRNYREHCPYGGGTVADARERITPIKRRHLDRQAQR